MPLIRKPQVQLENLYLKTIFLFSQLAADKFTLQCLQLVGQVDFHQIRIKETCIFRPECVHLLICIADDFKKCGQRKVPAVFWLSPTAFLPAFRMTMGGKGVIMRETLIVIRSGCEGSMPLIRNPQAQLENLYLKTAFYSPNSRRISSLFNVCSLSDKLISIKSGLRRRVYSGQSVSICLFA